MAPGQGREGAPARGQSPEDKVQLLEGELWTVELATQALDRHHKRSKHRMAEKLAKTLRQMEKLKDW